MWSKEARESAAKSKRKQALTTREVILQTLTLSKAPSEVVKATGFSATTVGRHLRLLVADGLVVKKDCFYRRVS